MRHQTRRNCSIDSVWGVVRERGLKSATFNDSANFWKGADWSRSHCSTAFVAVRSDSVEEFIAIIDLLKEGVEAPRVPFAWITFECRDESVREILARPWFPGDNRFGDCDAHLGVVGIATGAYSVARMLKYLPRFYSWDTDSSWWSACCSVSVCSAMWPIGGKAAGLAYEELQTWLF